MKLNLTATLLLFGLFQSAIMIFLIYKNRNWRQTQNKLLMALLFVVGLSLIPTFVGNAGLIEQYDFLRFIPFNLVIFIFPLLYFYLKSIFSVSFKLEKKSIFHFGVPIVFTIYYIFIWIGSLSISKREKGTWVSELAYFEVQSVYNFMLLFLTFGYMTLSIRELKNRQDKQFSSDELKYSKWITYLLVFFFIGVLLELSSTILGRIYGYWKNSPLDDWLGFSLTMMVKIYNAILLYIISLVGYLTYSNLKPNRNSLDKNGIENQVNYVLSIMQNEKPFLDKDFSLTSFSKQLKLSPSVLSNLLNTHLKASFNDFTNKFRVNTVIDRLQDGAYTDFTIESIAKDSGFKSKTTFYRAFFKFTSQTPKEFIAQLKKEKKVS